MSAFLTSRVFTNHNFGFRLTLKENSAVKIFWEFLLKTLEKRWLKVYLEVFEIHEIFLKVQALLINEILHRWEIKQRVSLFYSNFIVDGASELKRWIFGSWLSCPSAIRLVEVPHRWRCHRRNWIIMKRCHWWGQRKFSKILLWRQQTLRVVTHVKKSVVKREPNGWVRIWLSFFWHVIRTNTGATFLGEREVVDGLILIDTI